MKSWRCIGRIFARRRAGRRVWGEDHFAHGDDSVALKHMLGAAKTDALGAEAAAVRAWRGFGVRTRSRRDRRPNP